MGKFYRTFFLFMVLMLASLNIVFFIYNQNLEDYLNEGRNMGNTAIVQESSDAIVDPSLFNQGRFDDPKFRSLEYFPMDSSDFDLPDNFGEDGEDLDLGIDDSEEEDLPEFEVGNPNPFAPF